MPEQLFDHVITVSPGFYAKYVRRYLYISVEEDFAMGKDPDYKEDQIVKLQCFDVVNDGKPAAFSTWKVISVRKQVSATTGKTTINLSLKKINKILIS